MEVGLERAEEGWKDEVLVGAVFETPRCEPEDRDRHCRSHMSQSEMGQDTHRMSFAGEAELVQVVDHGHRRVGYLGDISLGEVFHQGQPPYYAYRGRRRELEQTLELVTRLG